MPRKQTDIERGLKNKGFLLTESHHHHYFIYHSIAGKKTTVKTKTSHGQREISDDLIGKMAQQVKLNRSEFLNLVDCSLFHACRTSGAVQQGKYGANRRGSRCENSPIKGILLDASNYRTWKIQSCISIERLKSRPVRLKKFKNDYIQKIVSDFQKTDFYEDDFLKDLEAGLMKLSVIRKG